MMKSVITGFMTLVSIIAGFAAKNTVNSTCNLIVYEPKMPATAERLIK